MPIPPAVGQSLEWHWQQFFFNNNLLDKKVNNEYLPNCIIKIMFRQIGQ